MDALTLIIRTHGPALRLYARQWIADAADADDAVQEALVACWKRDPDLGATTMPYVFTTVRHAALNLRRGQQRRSTRGWTAGPGPEPWFVCPIAAAERCSSIELALRSLPKEQREVIVLPLWGGLTFAEIGVTTACPSGAQDRDLMGKRSISMVQDINARHR